jgi:hypothetical protein
MNGLPQYFDAIRERAASRASKKSLEQRSVSYTAAAPMQEN